MTLHQFKIIFYSILGFCVLSGILSYVLFDFIEADTAVDWTMKYFALPILITMIPCCWFVYLRFIRQKEKKEYASIIWTRLRTVFRIISLTFGMTFIFIATTLSLIILTNAYMGSSKVIQVNATIVDYYTLKNKGKKRHYIKIKDQQFNRIIDLKVQEPYKVGDVFRKEMKIGRWGLLYSEE